MKLSLPKYLLFSLTISIVGCGFGAGPGSTAIEMFKKVCSTNDYSAMLEYAAPESAPFVAMGVNIAKADGKPEKNKICTQGIKVVSEEVTDNTAVVTMSGDVKPMNWKKIDGKWKFYIKK